MPEFLTNMGSSVTNFAGKCVDPIVTSMINNPKLAVALIAGSGFYVNKYADYVTLIGKLSPLKDFKWRKNNHFSKDNLKLVLNVSKRTFDLVVSAPWKLLCIGQKNLVIVHPNEQYIYEREQRSRIQPRRFDFALLTSADLILVEY